MTHDKDNKTETEVALTKVIFEGQEYDLPKEIAADDKLLRDLLVPFAPAVANAKIERGKPGEPVKIVKQAGTKGSTPLEILIASGEWINPAIALARQVQHLELSGGLSIEQMDALSEEIEVAIVLGRQEVTNYQNSLKALKSMPETSSTLPFGF
jgi:hypothetical protein